jgi:hypothetical protein
MVALRPDPVRHSFPVVRVFLHVLLLLCGLAGLLVPVTLARAADSALYEVRGVVVTHPIPATGSPTGDPRIEAMAKAGSTALRRLLKRMVPHTERQSKVDTLTQAEKNVRSLIDREVMRGEKRRTPDAAGVTTLELTVDLFFSRDRVRALLDKAGIPYNERPYPTVLLLADDGTTPQTSRVTMPDEGTVRSLAGAMRDAGMDGKAPLGDMDDLMNLTWDQVQRGDPALYRWLDERYQAGRIWIIRTQVATAPKSAKGAPPTVHLTITEAHPGGIAWSETQSVTAAAAGATAQEQDILNAVARPLLERIQDRWIQHHLATPATGSNQNVVVRLRHPGGIASLAPVIKRLQRAVPGETLRYLSISRGETVVQLQRQGPDGELVTLLAGAGLSATRRDAEMVVQIP